jgi:peptidyl-prolyl cis-trans isomerase SurA
MLRNLTFSLAVLLCLGTSVPAVLAQDQKVLVTVNDQPITSFDVKQRISLWKLLGDKRGGDGINKRALNELIDDIAVVEEAKKFGAAPSDKDVDVLMQDYAKGLKTDSNGMQRKLKAQGISVAAMRQYLSGRIAFNRMVRGRYKEDFSVSDSAVKERLAQYKSDINRNIDSQIAKIEADPRRRAVTVYELLPITFPVDVPEGGVTPELINSRAIEANKFISRFNGCGNARSAASGIFNVKVGKRVDANSAGLQKQLKQALDRNGPGKAIGPIPTPKGVEVIAFCGVRKITPPKVQRPKDIAYPTADQVRNVLQQEKMAKVAAKYSGTFRKGLYIEYRDPTYSQ